MNSCESPRPRLFRFLDLPDQGFMVVPLPTVRPTTSSMEPASTATVEPASTTVKSAATAPCATHHGAGMETPSSRSRPVIDAVGITAPGYIVRAVPPVTGICAGASRVVFCCKNATEQLDTRIKTNLLQLGIAVVYFLDHGQTLRPNHSDLAVTADPAGSRSQKRTSRQTRRRL
jgi:hypothetical protein